MQEDNPMNNIMFQLMSLEYKIKSFFWPPEKILAKTSIEKGNKIVDYGCGPGRYTIPAAEIAGENGEVYAIDIHPLALEKVNKAAERKDLKNIKTLFAQEIEKIEEKSIDIVILFDTLHDINDKKNTLKAIDKILKSNGILTFKDHHLKKRKIKSLIANNTSLILNKDKKKILEFKKSE